MFRKNADWQLQGLKTSIYLYSFPPADIPQEAEKKHFRGTALVKIWSQAKSTIQIAASKAPGRPQHLTAGQLQDCNRVSQFCHLRLNFNQQRNCILSSTCNILPFLGGWPSSHRSSQPESNSRQRLKMQISLPCLLQWTGAFLSHQLAKLIQKNHSWVGGKRFSCTPGNKMQLHFVAVLKLYNADGLSIYLVCVKGRRKGKSF